MLPSPKRYLPCLICDQSVEISKYTPVVSGCQSYTICKDCKKAILASKNLNVRDQMSKIEWYQNSESSDAIVCPYCEKEYLLKYEETFIGNKPVDILE